MGWLEKVGAHGELIPHCAGEDEESCFVLGAEGKICFEVVCGGVFGEDIVEEGGVCDGF